MRQAIALLIDRKSVEDHIYGRTGIATGNFVNGPPKFVSNNTKWEFNIDKANKILDDAHHFIVGIEHDRTGCPLTWTVQAPHRA